MCKCLLEGFGVVGTELCIIRTLLAKPEQGEYMIPWIRGLSDLRIPKEPTQA